MPSAAYGLQSLPNSTESDVVRTHGWSGYTPADDNEAAERIITAAAELIDGGVTDISILQVAKSLGIARTTVYRYFPDAQAMVRATAERATQQFLDGLADGLAGISDPAEASIEAIALTTERLRAHRRFGLLFAMGGRGESLQVVTSSAALSAGRTIVGQFDVDWTARGWSPEEIDELVELMLRLVQSLLADPGEPQRSPGELRNYLHRWIAPAITALHPVDVVSPVG